MAFYEGERKILLVNSRKVIIIIDEQIMLSQRDHNLHAIWSLLPACGHLKVESYAVNVSCAFFRALLLGFKVYDPEAEETLAGRKSGG